MGRNLSETNQLPYLLALLRLPKVGPVAIHRILKEHAELSALFTGARAKKISHKTRCRLFPEIEINWSLVEKDLAFAAEPLSSILTLDSPEYPSLLKEIPAAPPLLFVKGNFPLLNQAQIAIVGSRNPTPLGKNLAFEFAEYFASLGITVTSGLALGIDAAAHQGALHARSSAGTEPIEKRSRIEQQGGTIAVLGNGLDQIYPKAHEGLAKTIIESGGVLLSEFPSQEPPQASHFPRRNRIISGLSLGTVVVEAALNSGSLITAKHALEQGREIFAIPGSIHNPLAKGCHHLIQQGAKLVQTAQDVLEELKPLSGLLSRFSENEKYVKKQDAAWGSGEKGELGRGLEGELWKFFNCISPEAITMDQLVEASGLTIAKVSSMLLELMLRGLVISVPPGYARVVKTNF